MNRHVIISGGVKGLGLELTRRMLSDGYRVSSFGRTASPAVDELGATFPGQFRFKTADIAEPDQLRGAVEALAGEFGPPWAVVNNSAVAVDGVLATLPEVEIDRMLNVNLSGTIRLARHAVRLMLRSRADGGRIVNISSIVGTRGYNGLAVYSATKAGLDGFTRSLAREVGRRGITVNSIAPGYMKTDMSAGLGGGQLDQIVRRTPLGRLAEPRDVAGLLSFLLSDDAAFITAQTILVDGGISN